MACSRFWRSGRRKINKLKKLQGALLLVLMISVSAWAGCPGNSCQDSAPEPVYPGFQASQTVQSSASPEKSPVPRRKALKGVSANPDQAPAKEVNPDSSFFRNHQTVDNLSDYLKSHPEFIVVVPERPTPVKLSASDMNRITCMDGPIRDMNYSGEKGLIVKLNGREAYVKYKVLKTGDRSIFARNPTELIINCNDHIYTLITVPERIPTQTVRLIALGSAKEKANRALFTAMSVEQKMLSMIKSVYSVNIPETFTVVPEQEEIRIFRDVELFRSRTITADGEGLKVRELLAGLRKNSSLKEISLEEVDFLHEKLGGDIVGVSLEKPNIKAGEVTRIFIIEATRDSEN
jgi:conjugal transfer pilus assembly protein TraK